MYLQEVTYIMTAGSEAEPLLIINTSSMNTDVLATGPVQSNRFLLFMLYTALQHRGGLSHAFFLPPTGWCGRRRGSNTEKKPLTSATDTELQLPSHLAAHFCLQVDDGIGLKKAYQTPVLTPEPNGIKPDNPVAAGEFKAER